MTLNIADPVVLRNDPTKWDGYNWRDESFVSVSSAISAAYPKPWLGPWYAKMAGEAFFNERERFDEILTAHGVEAARKFLSGAANRNKTKGATSGTIVHQYIEDRSLYPDMELGDWLTSNPVRDEVLPFLKQATLYLESPEAGELVMAEAPVFNRTHSYAGTLDMIVRVDGEVRLRDVKTNKNLGESMPIQLSAYRNAEFIAHADGITEIPMVEVAATEILWIRPKSWKLIPVEAGPEEFATFLALKQVAEYAWAAKRPGS